MQFKKPIMSIFLRSVLAMFCLVLISPDRVMAGASHLGTLDLDLSMVDAKGKSKSLKSESGDFRLDWKTKKCELVIKGVYFYCTLDRSQDLKDQSAKVLVREMPIAHFDAPMMDAMITRLGLQSDDTKDLITTVVADTAATRSQGGDVPFYTCGTCIKTEQGLPIWNVFDSYVERKFEITHSRLSDRKLVFSLKLRKMSAVKNAFNIIGRENADSYINH